MKGDHFNKYPAEVHGDPRLSLDIPINDDFLVSWSVFPPPLPTPQAGFTVHNILKETINRRITPKLSQIPILINDESEFAVSMLFPPSHQWQWTAIVEQSLI